MSSLGRRLRASKLAGGCPDPSGGPGPRSRGARPRRRHNGAILARERGPCRQNPHDRRPHCVGARTSCAPRLGSSSRIGGWSPAMPRHAGDDDRLPNRIERVSGATANAAGASSIPGADGLPTSPISTASPGRDDAPASLPARPPAGQCNNQTVGPPMASPRSAAAAGEPSKLS